MIWNPVKRQYEDNQGHPIPVSRIRRWLEDYIEANREEIGEAAMALIAVGAAAGLIGEFFSVLRDRITTMHGTAGVVAYGGEEEMNPERWARLTEKINGEFQYAAKFEQSVSQARRATDQIIESVSLIKPEVERGVIERVLLTNAPAQAVTTIESIIEVPVVVEPLWDTLIWGEVGSRARLYADSVWGTHELSIKAREMDAGVLRGRRVTEGDENVCDGCEEAASEEYVPLEELLDIGDAECQSRCRCTIEFDYHGIEPIEIEREVYA